MPPMQRSQAAAWNAFFMKLHGRIGTFLLADPDAKEPRGSITGSPTLNANASIGDFTIDIATAQNSESNIFLAGDYIQLGSAGTTKLYMVVDDATSNASGVVTVQIEPSIKLAATSGAAVTINNPRGLFRMTTDELGWDADYVSRYGITFACTEAY